MNIDEYLEEGEEIQTMIKYDYPVIHRTKILGMTNTRSFMYWRSRNKQRFASSNRSNSHVEFGYWRMPAWMWALLVVCFIGPINLYFQDGTNYKEYALGMMTFPIILTAVCIYFRKFHYLGSSIGTEFIHIICRKGGFHGGIQEFLQKIHAEAPFGRPVTEKYVVPNYLKQRLRTFIIVFAIISMITLLESLDSTMELGGL